jgi:hypothetical protein
MSFIPAAGIRGVWLEFHDAFFELILHRLILSRCFFDLRHSPMVRWHNS